LGPAVVIEADVLAIEDRGVTTNRVSKFVAQVGPGLEAVTAALVVLLTR
jgi:hypothetical protein